MLFQIFDTIPPPNAEECFTLPVSNVAIRKIPGTAELLCYVNTEERPDDELYFAATRHLLETLSIRAKEAIDSYDVSYGETYFDVFGEPFKFQVGLLELSYSMKGSTLNERGEVSLAYSSYLLRLLLEGVIKRTFGEGPERENYLKRLPRTKEITFANVVKTELNQFKDELQETSNTGNNDNLFDFIMKTLWPNTFKAIREQPKLLWLGIIIAVGLVLLGFFSLATNGLSWYQLSKHSQKCECGNLNTEMVSKTTTILQTSSKEAV